MATAVYAETSYNSTFDVAHPRKLKFYAEIQQRKPKDRSYNGITVGLNVASVSLCTSLISLSKFIVIISV
jgi:hypothetical protein